MKLQNGGYVIVTHDDANIYEKVASAYENGKPILFYDDDKKCYYIDSIDKGENIYTLVKGGKTFEVTSNNTLSSKGEVNAPTMENIKDLNGNLRFDEGNGILTEITGLTGLYIKWSLSGTHLMLVFSGKIDANATINADELNVNYTIPKFIGEKIFATWGNVHVESKTLNMITNAWSTTSSSLVLDKVSDTELKLSNPSGISSNTSDRFFKIQFDLLIDVE